MIREREDQNEYRLTLTIPNQVSHSFDTKVKISHPYAKQPLILYLHFSSEETDSVTNNQNLKHEVTETETKTKEVKSKD